MKKTILLTGASGFVGQAFLERFSGQFNIVSVSLRKQKPESLDFSKVDVILHLAGVAHATKSIAAQHYFSVNTELPKRLAEAAKAAGVKHFIYMSSVKVYGEDGWFSAERRVLDVSSPCNPTDPYGQSKLAAEKGLMKLEDNDFSVSIVRPCLIYRSNAKGNIASLVRLMRVFRVLPLGYRLNTRSVIEMHDLLSWLENIIGAGSTGISIPGPMASWSLYSMLSRLSEDLGIRVLILPAPRFLVAFVSLFLPQFAKRLFGDFLFVSGCSGSIRQIR